MLLGDSPGDAPRAILSSREHYKKEVPRNSKAPDSLETEVYGFWTTTLNSYFSLADSSSSLEQFSVKSDGQPYELKNGEEAIHGILN